MTIKRTTTIGFRCPLSLLDDIEKLIKPIGVFDTASDVIRECTKVGMQLHNYQEMMKDPEKAEEFRLKMQEIVKTEEMDQWADSMSSAQLDGFLMFLQMKKDSRVKMGTLV